MSYNSGTKKWINWIDEAISKKHVVHYEFENFNNFQEINTYNGIVKIYRANWKNWKQCYTLKTLSNFDNIDVKELVHEVNHIFILKNLLYIFIYKLKFIFI